MPAPRDSRLIPDAYECRGMPEARMHGVGETPPVGVNGDRTAELASGSRVGVSYRIPDRRSSAADQKANRDTGRRVKVYNSAGLASANRTRQSRRRSSLHRLAYGMGALAPVVNASLVTVMIFQTSLPIRPRDLGWVTRPRLGYRDSASDS